MPLAPLAGPAALAVAVCAAAAVAAGCGASAGAGSAATLGYLQQLHGADPQINQARSDQSLVRLGQAACADFSSGVPFASVAEQLQSTAGLSPEELGTVLTAAVDNLCPKYRSEAP